MPEVLKAVLPWQVAGESFAMATVVSTFRSAPQPPGASMAVSAAGEVVGSVSGGCVEGAVYESAQEVMRTGQPVLERYGVSDDDAFAVGLTCGGILHVFIEPVDAERYRRARRCGGVSCRARAGCGGHPHRRPGPLGRAHGPVARPGERFAGQ